MAGIDHLTSNGTIRIEREIYRQAGLGRDDRIDRWLGLAEGNVSVEARELCCRIVLPGGSFLKAAENLWRLGQIRISDERVASNHTAGRSKRPGGVTVGDPGAGVGGLRMQG